MDSFRADRYERLDSSDDMALRPPDYSIELTEYDSLQDKKKPNANDKLDNDPLGDSPEIQQTSYSRSIFSNRSNPFADSCVELDDEQLRTLDLKKNRRNIVGWRTGVIISTCIAGTVFIINLLFFVIAMATVGQRGGIGTLYQGDCNVVKKADTIIHLILNILGVAVLGASNYTAQCLSSPTRREIDTAHLRRKALDIGLPSASNLRFMSWTKIALWSFLLLSTLPLHLFWNSSVFSTLQTNEYMVLVGTPDFLNNGTTLCTTNSSALNGFDQHFYNGYGGGSIINCSVVDSIRSRFATQNYIEMSPSELIGIYASTFLVGHRNVILIMNTTSPDANYLWWPPTTFPTSITNASNLYETQWPHSTSTIPADMKNSTNTSNSTLVSIFDPLRVDPFEIANPPNTGSNIIPTYQWLCNYYTINGTCSAQAARNFEDSWQVTPALYPIETGYSENVPPLCKLEYASLLVSIVLICNTIKTICMALTAWKLWRLDNPILVTVGDAASSFLERPDDTTIGYCLMDRSSVKAWKERKTGVEMYNPPKTLRFFRTASIQRWVCLHIFCLGFIGTAGALLQMALEGMESGAGLTEKEVWDAGFGTLNPTALLSPFKGPEDTVVASELNLVILQNVLVANSPQLILSLSYFLYNAIYTAQIGAYEWSKYSSHKEPLRVTFPRGNQRSTYWLQLPFRYSIPLSAAFAMLHYFISQSIFLANIEYYDAEGNIDYTNYQAALGYSPIAILASILLGSCVLLALLFNSFRKLNPAMPLMGNNSAVISAACHPDPNDADRDLLPFKAIRWGSTTQPQPGRQFGHCSFTTKDVELPVVGDFYE